MSLHIGHPYNDCVDLIVRSYDGNVIVKRSIELGEPVVYVSMNYRYVLILTTLNAYTDTLL